MGLDDRTRSSMDRPQRQGQAASPGLNPLQWVHYLLRGRYHWAVLLAVVFAGVAGYVQYNRVELLYQATGRIQIKSYVPKLLYGNEMTGRMPNYDGFLDSQVQLLQSERVVDMAMSSEDWRAVGRPFTPEIQEAFHDGLHVSRGRGSDYIMVSFRDPEREVTQAAVKSVIEAYARIFAESDPRLERRRMQLLDERRLNLATQLNSVRNQINTFGDAFGPDGVKYRYQLLVNQVRDIEQSIAESQLGIVAAQEQLANPPTPVDLAQTIQDPEVVALRGQIENKELRLTLLAQMHGEEHVAVVGLRERLEQDRRLLEEKIARIGGTGDGDTWQQDREREIQALKIRVDELRQLRIEANKSLAEVSAEKNRLEALESESSSIRAKLAEIESRIYQLNVESAMGDRMEILDYGQAGQRPVNVNQPMEEATTGALAGAGLGIGLVMLFGLINPTLRHSSDLNIARGGARLLGVLPHLPEQFDTPEQAYFAGQCVHQIRMLLQLEGGGDDVRSFVVTGPVSGAGKTSLTMALGLSYAAAGARTLLIDFDLVGAGLTHRFGASPKRLGRLLRDQGIEPEVVQSALGDSVAEGHRLGDTLVERNIVSRDELDRLLKVQQRSQAGLLDVLGGAPLDECVTQLPMENLHLLAVGTATAEHTSRVGRASVKRLLKEVHEKYDVILIDTGPAPGSVEASLIAALADRVVVIASRGDQVSRLNDCLDFLRSVGSTIAGVVYNRAEKRDMERSTYASARSQLTVSRRPLDEDEYTPGDPAGSNGHGHGHGRGNGAARSGQRLGPVAGSVAGQTFADRD